jgi:hypothetical protein
VSDGLYSNLEEDQGLRSGVEKQRDKMKRSPVYLIHPGKRNASFYRARVATDHAEVSKFMTALEKELGPPPERLRKAGRLNPSGVATFYGAFEVDTCIAELRPDVGSLVVSARFSTTEPICVLDTTRFAARPRSTQLFRRDEAKRSAQWNFMQGFSKEISKPVSPGNEHLDYIPTQAVAEYLANHLSVQIEGQTRNIDAIIYASAQKRGGKNIAILGGAGIVGQSPGKQQVRPPTNDDGIFGFLPSMARPKNRLIPVAKSFQCHEIEGANFDKRKYLGSFGRREDDHDEDW